MSTETQIVVPPNANGGGSAAKGGALKNGRGGRLVATGALTSQQRKFVRAYVENGGNAEAAKRTASYRDSVRGWVILQAPSVRAAINIEREKVIDIEGGTVGLHTIMKLCQDDEVPSAVRLKAAMYLYDKAHPTAAAALPGNTGKPLSDMSLQELDDYIAKGHQTLNDLKQIKAEIVEIPNATPPNAQDSEPVAHDA